MKKIRERARFRDIPKSFKKEKKKKKKERKKKRKKKKEKTFQLTNGQANRLLNMTSKD